MVVPTSTKNKFEQMREDAIQRILDAAKELFASNGYAATTIQMIAKQADLVPSAIYHYFSGKEGVLEAVLNREVSAIDQDVYTALQQNRLPDEIDGFFDYMANAACKNLARISLLCHLVQFRCVPEHCSNQLSILQHFHEIMRDYIPDDNVLKKVENLMVDFSSFAVFYSIAGHREIFDRKIRELKEVARDAFPCR